MFCYQCEETAKGEACTKGGACGKSNEVADLQDQLIYMLKGLAAVNQKARDTVHENPGLKTRLINALKGNEQSKEGEPEDYIDSHFMVEALFSTVTNVNFSATDFEKWIQDAYDKREQIKSELQAHGVDLSDLPQAAKINPDELGNAESVSILATEDEDIRSLRELLVYGLKGMAAYAYHASVLGHQDKDIAVFIDRALVATLDDSLSVDDLTGLVLECGSFGVKTMAMLDEANTTTYGHPEPTEINIGTGNNPGILISGHDLKDMDQLLKQTEGTGVDVYTHGEMLPANAYPEFKKYEHLVGNYGGSWWQQKTEFEKFNGPVLMTTNCLVPPKDSYSDRVFTTAMVGFEGLKHIEEKEGGTKDFSEIIEMAKQSRPPEQLENGAIPAGFAHNAALSVADKIVDAVKAGQISRFIVMAGCDGRQHDREYYTEFAKQLPQDAVILTAGCAKYRYNKLDLGDIGGIPRVLDAGQCNDSYSLVVIAQKLAEAFELDDINDLPVSYNIAWYEQKAVLVLLALLSLGVKDIVLGPRLPAFVSPNVLNVLVENFNISKNTTVENDLERLL
ncbi:hydroxylamine reductase [Methanohalophilus halophilus]|uniref:Hydroxylamine reductase n=1 Tax=Methanohalophilus halophilus TaxID=2177 RepID=A0A1L3Q2R7_9EURY|nr:hydroxylamine reductase [Methanohalophilus halophilus]APH39174.1 hydroxylamine reductase [Methanohalophilus halophilus]RNI09767.1 hydroxylamine reductase [Methanohalophilus halophilus]SDW56332.1 hydroxylamine reductase [Methanohalophilus halophilus]